MFCFACQFLCFLFKKMMDRQVVKQASAMFRIEELDFEGPAFTSQGGIFLSKLLLFFQACMLAKYIFFPL